MAVSPRPVRAAETMAAVTSAAAAMSISSEEPEAHFKSAEHEVNSYPAGRRMTMAEIEDVVRERIVIQAVVDDDSKGVIAGDMDAPSDDE